MNPVYVRGLVAASMAIVAFFVLDDWRIFLGVFLMLWANNIGVTCPTCRARDKIARGMAGLLSTPKRDWFSLQQKG